MRFFKGILSILVLIVFYYYISVLLTDSYIQIDRPSKESLPKKHNLIYDNYDLIIKNEKIYTEFFKDNFEIILDKYTFEKSYGIFYLFKHKITLENDIWIAFIMKSEINETLYKIKYDEVESSSLFGDRNGLKLSKDNDKCLIRIFTNKDEEIFDVLIKL